MRLERPLAGACCVWLCLACVSEDRKQAEAADTETDLEDGIDRFDASQPRTDSLLTDDSSPPEDTELAEETMACEHASDCGEPSACERPTCDPDGRCATESLAGGFCSASAGAAWGSCDGRSMAPVDLCTDQGCVDRPTPADAEVPVDRLAGDWFLLLRSASEVIMTTAVGVAQFSDHGNWGGEFKTRAGDRPFTGVWCLDAALGVALTYGTSTDPMGQIDPGGAALAAVGGPNHDLVVGLRFDGEPPDVTGTYRVLMATLDGQGQLEVLWGSFELLKGCLVADSSLRGEATELEFKQGPCMGLEEERIWYITPQVKQVEHDLVSPMNLRVAIGEGGGVLLLHHELGSIVNYGMILAVRSEPTVESAFRGDSHWIVALHERPDDTGYRSAVGALHFRDTALVTGILAGEPISGERFAIDSGGHFVLTGESAARQRTWSGYLSPQRGFGFFYEVAATDGWTNLDQVGHEPAHPSVGIIVRRHE